METNSNTEKLIASVCSVFCVSIDQIKSKSRMREVCDARKAIAYIMKKYFDNSPMHISMQINKHHSTINYICNEAEILMRNDKAFGTKMNQVKSKNGLDDSVCPHCGRKYEYAK